MSTNQTWKDGGLGDTNGWSNSVRASLQEPFIVSHRGGSNIYPENTMVAFQNIVAAGIRVIEMDVQLLADGALGVMHDSTVDRTTNGTGNVSTFDAYAFTKLVVDASQWLPGAKDTSPPLFEDLLRTFGDTVVYVPESKDTSCAEQIAQTLSKYGLIENAIIQSFWAGDLQKAVPYGVKTLLLGDAVDINQAKSSGFTYIGHSTSATDTYIQNIISAGLKPVVWTINSRTDFNTWKSKGCVGCFSDDPLWISASPSLKPRTSDPFSFKAFTHGHIAYGPSSSRGGFLGTNRWGWSGVTTDYVLQGWGSPIAKAAQSYGIQYTQTFEQITADTTRWGSCAFASPVDLFSDFNSTFSNAYHILMRANGTMDLYKIVNGSSGNIGTLATPAIVSGGTATIKIDVTPTNITVTRTDVAAPNSITVNDTVLRGGHFFLNHNGAGVSYSAVSIT